jgi:hypothetical protein
MKPIIEQTRITNFRTRSEINTPMHRGIWMGSPRLGKNFKRMSNCSIEEARTQF